MPPRTLERYRSIVDDWDAFIGAIRRPPPYIVRTNTLRIDPASLIARLQARGLRVRQLPWLDELLEVPEPPGRQIEHWLGLYYVQEATQALPVLALDPKPGENVLDLCAAPGGKATFIAERMQNRGALICNEPNGRRQMGLLANLNRMGVLVASVTAYHGESFPRRTSFDRVLVDAPCSSEGTIRKDRSLRAGVPEHAIARLAQRQRRLIVRAFDLLALGGILVYSTCTFAPEENELVVAHLLAHRDAELVPLRLPVDGSPGVTEWEGTALPKEMAYCRRVYPHHLNSGGGFVACIRTA